MVGWGNEESFSDYTELYGSTYTNILAIEVQVVGTALVPDTSTDQHWLLRRLGWLSPWA